MKKVAISLGVLIAFVVFSVLWETHLDAQLHAMDQMAETAMQQLENGELQTAHAQLQEAAEQWETTQVRWSMMINHTTLEMIGGYLHRSIVYAEQEEPTLACAELVSMRLLIQDLEHIHDFQLGNLF